MKCPLQWSTLYSAKNAAKRKERASAHAAVISENMVDDSVDADIDIESDNTETVQSDPSITDTAV